MYAIIESGGKQFKVGVGDVIYIEKIDLEPGSDYSFDKVLCLNDENSLHFGEPYLSNATVKANVIKIVKGRKIRVFKYKPKKNYKRTQGHKQQYSKLEIKSINF